MRVRIVAQDEAQAVIDNFTKRLDRARKPAHALANANERVSKSTGKLNQAAAGDPFGRITNGLRSVRREAESAFHGVGRLSAGLSTLTEIGGWGGAGAAGAALGAAALVKHWSDVGMATSNAAANIGITTGELYRYQRAAALTGVSSDAVTGSLTGLSQTMFQAANGLNPNAANMLRLLGVRATDAHGKMLPIAQLLPQIADSVDKLSPQGQMAAVSGLGMSADMLPFLRQGGAKINAELAQLSQQGVGNNFGGANAAYADFQKLETAADNAADKLAQKFAPAIDSATTDLASWIGGIPGFVQKFQDSTKNPSSKSAWGWLTDPNVGVGTALWNAGADSAGWAGKEWNTFANGWNNTFGPQSVANAKARTAAQVAVRDQGMAYFQSQGWTKAQAAAIMGNVEQESNFDPGARNPTSGTAGLFQWSPARAAQIKAGTGIDIYKASAQQQFQAAQWELTHTETKAAAALLSAQNAGAAAIAFDNDFERSGDSPLLQYRRGMYAQYINGLDDTWDDGKPKPSGAPRALPADVETVLAGLRAQQAAGGTVTVDINHNNVPPGTSATVKTSGPGVSAGGVKITKAMTGANV
jgi:hypothetical protein